MNLIPLTQGKFAQVDAKDYSQVGAFNWYAVKSATGGFYAARNVRVAKGKQKRIYLHKVILWDVPRIDHKDGNGLNCCRQNLRPATQKENKRASQKKAAGVSSRFRGVSWHKRDQRWQSDICVDGRRLYLGQFHNEKNAARAYDVAALCHFGRFASLNFPNI